MFRNQQVYMYFYHEDSYGNMSHKYNIKILRNQDCSHDHRIWK